MMSKRIEGRLVDGNPNTDSPQLERGDRSSVSGAVDMLGGVGRGRLLACRQASPHSSIFVGRSILLFNLPRKVVTAISSLKQNQCGNV